MEYQTKKCLEALGHNQLNFTATNVKKKNKPMFIFTILGTLGKGRDYLPKEKLHQIGDFRSENLSCFSICCCLSLSSKFAKTEFSFSFP